MANRIRAFLGQTIFGQILLGIAAVAMLSVLIALIMLAGDFLASAGIDGDAVAAFLSLLPFFWLIGVTLSGLVTPSKRAKGATDGYNYKDSEVPLPDCPECERGAFIVTYNEGYDRKMFSCHCVSCYLGQVSWVREIGENPLPSLSEAASRWRGAVERRSITPGVRTDAKG